LKKISNIFFALDSDYFYGICENCGNEGYLINGLCESCFLNLIEEKEFEQMIGNEYCIVCHEIMNGHKSNEKLIEDIIEFLKRKNFSEKEIKKIEKLKKLPICKWDLWKIVANVIRKKDKSLANYFEKFSEFYDFHWVIATF
jgi:NMD protein affecting ribosome stability and mRNA decay